MKSNDLTNATSTHPLDAYFNDYDHPKTATVTEVETKELNEHFNDQDRQKVQSLADQIEPLNHDSLLKFGSNAQTYLSHFSHQMLDEIQSKDVGPIGETLEQLMKKLKEVNPDELSQQNDNFLKKLFKRSKNSMQQLFSRMQSVSAQVDRISIELDKNKALLVKDIQLLDGLYQQNKDYFDVLNLYIAAAEQKKTEIEQDVLPEMRQRVKAADDQMVVQDVADMEQFVDRLEKRIYDLKLSRQISLQSAPQIRMIQNVNQALAEKIQSSILTSIPLWKNQMAIALTLQRQQKAATAQKQVTDTTNEILLRNSEMLRQNARVTAEENERGIVDIETLKTTQDNIIQTIEETLQIQQEGREKRQQAEKDLLALESDLKARLTTAKDQRDRQ
ncbi:toxic anion resistance protein [Staphylococcus pseudintermedius]|uniref:toxic anion resistance protein n=1 Tax=Staphylococcus pseudintermedius TaxID=283734 RepID=UPI0001FFAC67|nr:toxic anion resistance protein [Staphylococcus pseudintermedius]ADX76643.1 tellurite resistance protein, putative [Staphylococcus pseudintermedius ED99]EGQ0299666.1 toxic anion resistance protein [Staphylococcus pseudintermedius]EGQ0303183.1 toxic anion resistance protein [Staphylococcus pseudintermedius]EGQ0325192.1 toxic anion resistance protein [Staphylococcus pseudintermedius]EGQ0330654.1 toxic anion resistance protein [Staphylococcus pseudintermedius]